MTKTMRGGSALLFILVLLSGCKDDVEPDVAVVAPPLTNAEKISQLSPPPPECGLLTEEEIQDILPVEVFFPLPGQRAVNTNYSCQLDVDGDQWSGQVVVEYPREASKRKLIADGVAAATGADRVMINGNAAALVNNNKGIVVAAPTPYRVNFAAYPRKSVAPVWKPEEYREFLIAFAERAAE